MLGAWPRASSPGEVPAGTFEARRRLGGEHVGLSHASPCLTGLGLLPRICPDVRGRARPKLTRLAPFHSVVHSGHCVTHSSG